MNNFFSDFFEFNFPNFIVVYTNGSVSPLSTGYSSYIPVLYKSFTSNLPSFYSSFITECYAIIAIILIFSFLPKEILNCIARVFNLFLSNPFNFHFSSLVLHTKTILFHLNLSSFNIQLFWVLSHVGIRGHEVANSFAINPLQI